MAEARLLSSSLCKSRSSCTDRCFTCQSLLFKSRRQALHTLRQVGFTLHSASTPPGRNDRIHSRASSTRRLTSRDCGCLDGTLADVTFVLLLREAFGGLGSSFLFRRSGAPAPGFLREAGMVRWGFLFFLLFSRCGAFTVFFHTFVIAQLQSQFHENSRNHTRARAPCMKQERGVATAYRNGGACGHMNPLSAH